MLGDLLTAMDEQTRALAGFANEPPPKVYAGPDEPKEIDVDAFEFSHACPKCGFGFNA